jgi:c-di-AMP phosphodiesterase-like protein
MKKLIYLVVFAFLFINNSYSQQGQEKEVADAIEVLKKGIVDADKNILTDITAPELIYGHSNGRVQNQSEFIAEILSKEAIDYVKVDITEQTIKVTDNTAIVRHIYAAETLTNGKPGSLKIGNMLVWQKQNGKWKLLARQAYRM